MPKSALKVVQEEPKTRRKKRTQNTTVTQAVQGGTTKDVLIAMRDRIATAVDNPATPARELAALTKRLGDIIKEISIIEAAEAENLTTTASEDGEWEAI